MKIHPLLPCLAGFAGAVGPAFYTTHLMNGCADTLAWGKIEDLCRKVTTIQSDSFDELSYFFGEFKLPTAKMKEICSSVLRNPFSETENLPSELKIHRVSEGLKTEDYFVKTFKGLKLPKISPKEFFKRWDDGRIVSDRSTCDSIPTTKMLVGVGAIAFFAGALISACCCIRSCSSRDKKE